MGPEQGFALQSLKVVEMPGDRGFGVRLQLAAGNDFLDFSMQNVGKPLAIMVDDEPVIVLMLRSSLADQVVLAGDWTEAQASTIAAQLAAQRGTARDRVQVRGSEEASTGKPTIELAVVLHPGDELYDSPWMTAEYRGKEVRFGSGVSFEVAAAYASQDRAGRYAIGYKVVDVDGYRDFTGKVKGQSIGIMVNGKVMIIATVEGAIPGQGILTGGPDGFSDSEMEEYIRYLRGESSK